MANKAWFVAHPKILAPSALDDLAYWMRDAVDPPHSQLDKMAWDEFQADDYDSLDPARKLMILHKIETGYLPGEGEVKTRDIPTLEPITAKVQLPDPEAWK